MNEFARLLDDLLKNRLSEILIGCPAVIQSYNKTEGTASIKLLLKKKEGFKFLPFPVLSEIPVNIYYSGGFFMKPDYKFGDIVWVNFATHSTQNAMLGQSDESSESAFNIHDAFVVGAYKSKKNLKPALLQLLGKDGIVLGHEDGDAYINITKENIYLHAKKIINTDGIKQFDNLKHIHTSGAVSTPTSDPTTGIGI
jgi:hypothetical protein